ncbi:hypothetical protein ACQPZ8_01680 [Actinomadura nitritigenes]|uniref:hypothetical protein n=1 Tax=Actinomadura nitritigenes TaxID=134602 RepID=UPI003D94249B
MAGSAASSLKTAPVPVGPGAVLWGETTARWISAQHAPIAPELLEKNVSRAALPAPAVPPPERQERGAAEPTGDDERTRVRALREVELEHPGVLCWWGKATQQWWAYVPVGQFRTLVSADSLPRLRQRIIETQMQPNVHAHWQDETVA